MRPYHPLLAAAVAACASPAPVTPAPCEPACAGGAVCIEGACYSPADAGAEGGAVDAAPDLPLDAGAEAGAGVAPAMDAGAIEAGPDAAGVDAVAADAPPACDADLQRDPRNCGRCGNTCRGGCWRGACTSGICPSPPRPNTPTCTTHDQCASCIGSTTRPRLVPCCVGGSCALLDPSVCM